MATVERQPATQLRWSATHCPRLAIYDAENAPHRSRTEREERVLFRGRCLGRDYADLLAEKHGEENIEREKKIAWAFGVGHADVYVKTERHLVEVLSSASAGDVMIQRKLVQMVGYMEGLTEAQKGSLVIIDPTNFDLDITTVLRSSDGYRALAAEVAERVDAIRSYYASGELPPRVCRKPSDAIGHFCLHSEFCFAGWTPDPLPLIEDADVQVDAAALYRKKQERKALSDRDKALEAEQKEIEARLADRIERAGSYDLGQLKLQRVDVNRKPTIDARKMELAGYLIPDEAWKPGASYVTWRVERTGDGALPGEVEVIDDYGEVPF